MQIVMAMYRLIRFITYAHKMILWDFFGRKYLSEQHWQMRHIRLHGCIPSDHSFILSRRRTWSPRGAFACILCPLSARLMTKNHYPCYFLMVENGGEGGVGTGEGSVATYEEDINVANRGVSQKSITSNKMPNKIDPDETARYDPKILLLLCDIHNSTSTVTWIEHIYLTGVSRLQNPRSACASAHQAI